MEIENRLGVKLFDRVGRGIELNSHGKLFYESVSKALLLIDVASQRLTNQEQGNVLNLNVSPFFASTILIPNLKDFEDKYPDIQLKVQTGNDYIDLRESDIDLAIRTGGNDSGLSVQTLVEGSAITICSPDLVEGSKTLPPLETIDDLQGHSLINISSVKQAWPSWLKDVGRPNLRPLRYLDIDTTLGALDAVKNGLGVGLSLYPIIKAHSDYGEKIVSPFAQLGHSRMAYQVVCKPEDYERREIKLFFDWVISKLNKLWDK